MKNIRVRNIPSPELPLFGPSKKIYSKDPCIPFKYGKMWTRKTPNTDIFYAAYWHLRGGTTPSLHGTCPTTMAPGELTWDQEKYGLLTLFYITRKFRDKYLEKRTVKERIFFKVIGYVNTAFYWILSQAFMVFIKWVKRLVKCVKTLASKYMWYNFLGIYFDCK